MNSSVKLDDTKNPTDYRSELAPTSKKNFPSKLKHTAWWNRMKATSAVETADWERMFFFSTAVSTSIRKGKKRNLTSEVGRRSSRSQERTRRCPALVLTQNSMRKEKNSAWKVDQYRWKNLSTGYLTPSWSRHARGRRDRQERRAFKSLEKAWRRSSEGGKIKQVLSEAPLKAEPLCSAPLQKTKTNFQSSSAQQWKRNNWR